MEWFLPPDAPERYRELLSELVTKFDGIARGHILRRIAEDRDGQGISEGQAMTFAESARATLLGSYGTRPEAAAKIAREVRRRLMAETVIAQGDEAEAHADELQFSMATMVNTWLIVLKDTAYGEPPRAVLDATLLGDDLLPSPLAEHHAAMIDARLAWTALTIDDFRRIMSFFAGAHGGTRRLPDILCEMLSLEGILVVAGPA